MSTVVCPNGHTSTSTDYCDVCGAPIEASAPAEAPEPAAAGIGTATTCPHCGAPASSLALFCEVCGYDFTTGTAPAPVAPPAPVSAPVPVTTDPDPDPDPVAAALPTPAPDGAESWVAEVWVDPDWYAAQQPEDPMPSAGLPGLVPLRERSVLVGRPSVSRNIHPAVDCGTDSGVSRRHCQLNTDGQRWWVEDLQSANGTYVSRAGDPLPTTPIPAGQRKEIEDGDRLYLGAWTRIVIRTALPGEV
ncbi:FHA domain-containing protein [Cellulomonas sp. Root137]|uniref:FHA domain-containing protein n=1 Tax=Cellulomonas sp. Root137 TaxID=1736459 RepID=UPI0006F28F5F|nr:FHA domain-containing protein [Cellulomonas sp. Root137]KQY47039.1 phosphopeptide-binding protein [Cellulomonas sp. Root137]KRD44181.1 phosphopeptide-binding protein [Cellulomonas sp. Root930]